MSKGTLTKVDIQLLKDIFVTKEEFNDLKSEFQELKSDFGEFKHKMDGMYNMLVEFLKEIRDNREEQTILAHRSSDHEDRIQAIESKLEI